MSKKPKCNKCKSKDVYLKSIFYFNARKSAWQREGFSDEYHCASCGNECVDMKRKFLIAKVKV